MLKLAGIATAAILALAPAVAQATTLQTTDTSRPWQAWANAAQAPTYAGTLPLTVAPDYANCGGMEAQGCTSYTPQVDQTTGQIIQGPPADISTEIDNALGADDAKATLYHELGQVFWIEYMTPADEAQFMQIVGLPGTPADWGNWRFTRVENGVTLTFPPFEWFAEGYRFCATYGINQPAGVNDEEGLGYPGPEAWFAAQQQRVCQLIDQVGLENGIATPPQETYPAKTQMVPKHRKTHARSTRSRRRFTWGVKRVWGRRVS